MTTLRNYCASVGYDETADPDELVGSEVEKMGLITFFRRMLMRYLILYPGYTRVSGC